MKYMGSKSRIAKDIVPIIQKCIDDNNIETYVEPFVGGANVIDKINYINFRNLSCRSSKPFNPPLILFVKPIKSLLSQ